MLVGDPRRAEAARASAAAGRVRGSARAEAAAPIRPASSARAPRWPDPRVRTDAAGDSGSALTTGPFDDGPIPVERTRPAEAVGGFLAAASIAVSVAAMVYRPVRLAPFALVIAFIAVGLTSGRHARLAAFAVAAGAIGWLVGMTIAVLTGEPLY